MKMIAPNTRRLKSGIGAINGHQIGNDEITGLASNDGTVQVYVGDRGGRFLNHFGSHTDAVLHTQEIPTYNSPRPSELLGNW